MKKNISILILFISFFLLLGGCGYYFPSVYDGPTRTIYMPEWKNRTSKLGIDITLYKSLSRWFQQSETIILTKNKAKADLILAGEIYYIDLPSISWGGDTVTTDVKIKVGVRYVLKDLETGKILWEVPNEIWTEDYPAQTLSTTAENEALTIIIDDLSERIYIGTLNKIRKENLTKRGTP
ncbi:MAG: LPS assembly lipoprotein LptE [Desulfobulbaceae bacterium]|nr:LPS assembly lipoprotein LptE [Desulfobulbaceae bacterium]